MADSNRSYLKGVASFWMFKLSQFFPKAIVSLILRIMGERRKIRLLQGAHHYSKKRGKKDLARSSSNKAGGPSKAIALGALFVVNRLPSALLFELKNLVNLRYLGQYNSIEFQKKFFWKKVTDRGLESANNKPLFLNNLDAKTISEFSRNNKGYLKLYFEFLKSSQDDRKSDSGNGNSLKEKFIQYSFANGSLPNPSIVGLQGHKFDYFLLTDEIQRQVMKPWQTLQLGDWPQTTITAEEGRKRARFAKTNPQNFFPKEKVIIWRDSKILIDEDFAMELLERFIESGKDIGLVPHPFRSTVYEEIDALKHSSKDLLDSLNLVETKLRDIGFEQTEPLFETGFILYNLESKRTQKFLQDWNHRIQEVCIRDQVSVNFCLEQNELSVHKLFTSSQSIRNSGKSLVLGRKYNPEATGLETFLHRERAVTETTEQIKSVEIIVPVFNGRPLVEQMLNSLIELEVPNEIQLSVVLSDDGSEFGTLEILEKFASLYSFITVTKSDKNRGYTRNVNAGLAQAQADIVVILNSDTILPKSFLSKTVALFENSNKKLIIGPLSNNAGSQSIFYDRKSELKRILPWGLDTNLLDKFVGEMFPKNYLVDTPEVHGFCLIARSSAFKEIGYFNEEAFPFGNGEETDWCLRAREFGYKLAVLPSLFVFHHGTGSFDSSRKEQLVSLGLATLNKMYGEQVVSGLLHQHQSNLELNAAKNLIRLRVLLEFPPL